MFDLGWLYEKGQGVPRDLKRANELYRRAAALGNNEARRRLVQGTRQWPFVVVSPYLYLPSAASLQRQFQSDEEGVLVAPSVFRAGHEAHLQMIENKDGLRTTVGFVVYKSTELNRSQ